ncbi:MAG TPA: efflux RND transporter permease subunit [Candidatus Dormibacteraeota bacterium]|nr:efflux RND transporter permease subunit [Candidatus Dormibacteraeota bacterium]
MKLVDVCIRRPVATTMFIAFLVVLGWFSYRQLSVDLYPNVDFPITAITTTLSGASVEEMESSVTKPLEEAINTIEGIDELTSTTSEGLSTIVVFFSLSRDGDAGAQDVRDKVSTVMSQLPEGTDAPVVAKFDIESTPILSIVVSGNRDLREVTEIAKRQIKEDIETQRGVGSVSLIGGLERAINIVLDTDRLAAYGLSIDQVRGAIRAQNIEIPGGRVDQGQKELILRTMGRIQRAEDFRELIVGSAQGRPLRIADIGRVEDAAVEPRALARLDGHPAVTLLVRKQTGTNTVAVIDTVKKRLERIRSTLPGDIDIQMVRDQSRFIGKSIDEVKLHLVLAGILVSLTVMLFIANLRATLIAAVAIPTSIIATFSVMRYLDFSLNNVTMLALVLATGIVIDDAVVVLENIFRYMEEKGVSARQAASAATGEISLAVMATTLSLVVIFLPVAFMEGQVGRFFNSYGVTVAVAIMVSLVVSFTLTPMLCAHFLTVRPGRHQTQRGIYGAVDRVYGVVLGWSLRHRWVMMLLSFAVLASTVPLFGMVGKDFMPRDDQSEFEVIVQTPEGFSLQRTDETLRAIEARIGQLPHVTHMLTTIGDTSGRLRAGEGPVTQGSIYVRLTELQDRDVSQDDVMKQARAVVADYPDLRTSVQAVNLLISGGRRFSDLEFDLTGPSLAKLEAYSKQMMEGMRATPGLVDVDTTLSVRQPELQVQIQREKASSFGINVRDIASSLRTLIGGEPISTYREEQEQIDVWLRAQLQDRNDPRAIGDVTIAAPTGELVRLSNLAMLSEERGPAQIDHHNRQRKVTLVANLDGLPLGSAVERVRQLVAALDMPPNYGLIFSGRAKSLGESNANFLLAFLLSFIFMYMILAAQFESFLHPITIMLALPLTLPFALLSLWMLGETLNIYSILGLFMMFGIVKKNGILQIDYTNTLRAQGMARDAAILQANHVRLRPILMTTVMLVAGMIPIALGRGPGSASRASMAKVIIGGQTLCLLLTLLMTPVAYSLFDDLAHSHPLRRLRRLLPSRWRGVTSNGRSPA